MSKSNIDYFNKKITNINPLLWKLKKIEIFSDNLSREKLVNFEKDNEQIFSIIRNYNLYEILKKELSNDKYCYSKIFNNNDVSSLKIKDLIINCDPQNIITKKYFTNKITKKYNSRAFTTIIKHDKITNNTALQIFTREGPLAFLPISNNETSIVFSLNNYRDYKNVLRRRRYIATGR